MASELTGTVTFANGIPAAGVQVRIFDRDAPGKGDDDLTLEPGVSNERGVFTVHYEPGRFRDFAELPDLGLDWLNGPEGRRKIPDPLDVLTPYAHFSYHARGELCTYTADIPLFHRRFRLPETVPIAFQPSRHGFQFPNAFRGYMLPFSIPGFPPTHVKGIYGLCGGMSSAAYDHVICGRPVPPVAEVPRTGSRLQRYLFRRAIDTFAMGESILRFARWMALPEDGLNGTYRLTYESFSQLQEALNNHYLMVLGLVYDKGRNVQEIARNVWNNHQVLAYAYTRLADGSYDVHIYDPNYPRNDEIRLHLEEVEVGQVDGVPRYGLKCMQVNGEQALRPVRGFFPMPYEPVEPPL